MRIVCACGCHCGFAVTKHVYRLHDFFFSDFLSFFTTHAPCTEHARGTGSQLKNVANVIINHCMITTHNIQTSKCVTGCGM
jgi:hypothetical protein